MCSMYDYTLNCIDVEMLAKHVYWKSNHDNV